MENAIIRNYDREERFVAEERVRELAAEVERMRQERRQFDGVCDCGGSRERPNPDCERCDLVAEVERLTTQRDALLDVARAVVAECRNVFVDVEEMSPEWRQIDKSLREAIALCGE